MIHTLVDRYSDSILLNAQIYSLAVYLSQGLPNEFLIRKFG